MKVTCPEPADYRQLLDGRTNAEHAQSLSSHLGACAKCAEKVHALLSQDTLAGQLSTAARTIPAEMLPAGLFDRLIALSSERNTAEGETIGYPGILEPKNDSTEMLSPPKAPDELGRLGPFIVRSILGQGGMGIAFRAEDPRLEREVALKVIRPTAAVNPTVRQRFLSEARSAAKVKNDHIVTIYDIGESDGTAYVAMELLKGCSLAAALNGGMKFTLPQIMKMVREMALALAAAHEKGLIHRDIKPDNIWLEAPDQRIKLLDFGLARPIERDIQLTNDGVMVGTPAYMAPEQARGRGVDSRADLFSLGVVIYQMLTGRRPFHGTDTVAILSSLALDTPPAPHTINPECPPHLSALVMRLLEKEPSARLPSANAVLAALDPSATAVVPKAAPRRKFPVAAMALLAVLLLGGGAAAVYQFVFATKDGTLIVEVDEDADVRFKNGKLEIRDDKGELKYTLEPSEKNKLLPPGKYLVKVVGTDGVKLVTDVFELERKGKAYIRVQAEGPKLAAVVDPKKTDPVKPIEPSRPAGPIVPLTLEKGTWIPGPKENVLRGIIPQPAILDGVGRWQVVPTLLPAWGLSWSPDGKWVATHDDMELRLYDANTGTLANLFMLNNGQPIGQSPVVDWSPDSTWLRWSIRRPTGVLDGLTFAAIDGSLPVAKFETSANQDFGWNPKRNLAAWMPRSTIERIEIIDPTQAKPIEIAVKVGGNGKAVWSPDGEWLLVVCEDKTAQLFDRNGKPGAKLTGEVDPSVLPAWSADSAQIAAMAGANEFGFWKKDGTAGKKTGKHEKPVLALHWKPDGKMLAVTEAEGKRHFWKTDGTSGGSADTRDGTLGFEWAKDGRGFFTPSKFWPAVGNPSFTNLITGLNMAAVVSPDQKSVALAKRGEIVIAELNDGESKDIGWKVLQTRDGTPWWSADGKRLAVVEQNGVTLYDARDPAKLVQLGGGVGVNGFNRATFSSKGDRFAVSNNIGHVLICEPSGKPIRVLGTPSKVGATLADAIHDLHWHPDGKHLVVSTGGITATIYDTETGKEIAATSLAGARTGGGAIFSPANPDHLLIAHPDVSALWRWKVEREPIQKLTPGFGKLFPSPDGKKLLSLQAGGGTYGNDPVSASILSPDLKTRDTNGTKSYVGAHNHPGPSLVWHPDGKHLIVARDGNGTITFRTLDGKVAEEIKPEGIDVNQMEWASSNARKSVLVGRTLSEVYLFDVATKKLTPFAKIGGEVAMSPDGKYILALENSVIHHWNVETKAIERVVQLLPDGQYAVFSVAGEILSKSAKAEEYLRYLVEDKSGRLNIVSPRKFVGNQK